MGGDNKKRIMEFNKICQYRVSQLAYFLKRLLETTDGEANLLDQSMILWGSPIITALPPPNGRLATADL